MKNSRRLAAMATLFVLIVVLPCAVPVHGQQLDIAVDVAPLAQPDWPVEIKRVQLRGDDLLLQLRNRSPKPVIAVYVQYELYAPAGCSGEPTAGHLGLAEGDAQRVPGMTSVDIEPNGTVWYKHRDMASHLALSAVKDSKSRYLRVHAKITGVAFADGTKADWRVWAAKGWPEPKESDAENCARRPWDNSLRSIRGIIPRKVQKADTSLPADNTGTSVSFVCGVVNQYVVCAK